VRFDRRRRIAATTSPTGPETMYAATKTKIIT
jgi:hypothetical protein